MRKLTVNVSNHQYDVHIGQNVYDLFATDYAEMIGSADRIAIIADELAASLHISKLLNSLSLSEHKISVKIVPAGEQCKTSSIFTECHSFLLNEGFTRNSLLVAFGGGACGDLTGFVAATFLRGIRYIHCPTTILAHDSAVGGKTAINMPEGKNMVGSFHQPSAVLFNTLLFSTLPPREIRSGMAELLKHAFISSKEWTKECLVTENFLNPSIDWLTPQLLRGIQVKAKIVEEDEFEESSRKFLNFGHTFGHAVEAVCGFGELSHGESVMIGMAYSLILSERHGEIHPNLTNEFICFAKSNGYTFKPIHSNSFETFMEFMKKDKKASFGKLHFALLHDAGSPFLKEISAKECEDVFNELRKRTGE